MEKTILIDALKKYTSVVIWGLKDPTTSTQRHIHRHLFTVLHKIGCRVFWCENSSANNDLIENGSLVISSNQCCTNLQYTKDNWYAICHIQFHIEECKNFVNLRVYGDEDFEPGSVFWDKTTVFLKSKNRVYQSFGTNLLPEEFLSPVFNSNTNSLYWVGSIWNDVNNHGNIQNMGLLQKALRKYHIKFIHMQDISDEENIEKIRASRIAPAIGGDFQTKAMMPCRIWKNISYGQLGVTNLSKAPDVFGTQIIYDLDIDRLVEKALSLNEKEYKDMILQQQEIVAKDHTYLNWMFNIARALEELET